MFRVYPRGSTLDMTKGEPMPQQQDGTKPISGAMAQALAAAERGELRRWKEVQGFAAAGKTYAKGLGTVAKPTVDALMAAQPPLLAAGAETERETALDITEAGRDALRAYEAPVRPHVGRARR